MGHFDYSNPIHREIRKWRTLAAIARVHSESPAYRANADIWAYIAQAWTDLADIKERASAFSSAQ